MYRKVAPDAPPKADPDGPARLAGETESEYASRQARLEAAARERMREKFGGAPLPAAAVTLVGSGFASFAARRARSSATLRRRGARRVVI